MAIVKEKDQKVKFSLKEMQKIHSRIALLENQIASAALWAPRLGTTDIEERGNEIQVTICSSRKEKN